jgi:hypothetical protein
MQLAFTPRVSRLSPRAAVSRDVPLTEFRIASATSWSAMAEADLAWSS